MKYLKEMLWIEMKKAIQSRMPLWTSLGSLFMPFGMAFLIYLARNPVISHKLGLVSAKADLVAYSATDWSSYLSLSALIVAAGGFFIFVLVISWVFGREFIDGTVKDMLAVPVSRGTILAAKFIISAIWSIWITLVIMAASLVMGGIIQLPGGSLNELLHGSIVMMVTAILIILVILPFALLASIGRGYLLPLGAAVLVLMATNMVSIAGWGDVFPWAIPGVYVQGKAALLPTSYMIVAATALAGILATYYWWKYADQSR